ncbi:UxaA family hydrolase [Burkholderia multivorans]|uniref:UxaA family hydrolase n=1 Tax=Burkholderia multivorans TaxID=87883 RepID=UPI001C237967|nr:UxaA family hydrolase [Burkholderia multivorans]MBU9363456.1 UxaA family hydrolase [Burkholderia multivorans]
MKAFPEHSTFNGYVREDGRVGTRNYLGVLVAGNCAAIAARQVAAWFTPERLAAWPNVDGVVPFVHELGCGMEKSGEPMDLLRRTLGGTIRNANLAGAVVMALGCERNNIYGFLEQERLECGPTLQTVVLQEVGGTRAAIGQGIAAVRGMLDGANSVTRSEASLRNLAVGLIAARSPSQRVALVALGHAVDRLVAAGGTAILTDTVSGASALGSRSATAEVRSELEKRVAWWLGYFDGRDTAASRNPAASDSALTHSGSNPLQAVFTYGQAVPAQGLVLMDSPAHEGVAASGLVASGATLVTTASTEVSIFGAAGAPTLKIGLDAEQYARFADDLDIDGSAADAGPEELGDAIFRHWIACASGEPTRSEELGVGDSGFIPWSIGVMA